MKKENDVVFLHAGGRNLEGLQGPLAPIGMIGLASYLKKNNYQVSIINLLLEKALDDKLTDWDILATLETKIFCIDLHWFVHSFEAIALAETIKEIYPNSVVILGGLTASFFAVEILVNFLCIDFVIKGEAEEPLRMLVETLLSESNNYAEIPNLTYRTCSGVQNNPITYLIDQQLFEEIDFLDFEMINNWEQMFYLYNLDYQFHRSAPNKISEYYRPQRKGFWPVYTGRGCSFNCSFCGGSKNAFKRCFNRDKIILRSPEKVAADILKLNSLGIGHIYIPHSPMIVQDKYHHQLLDILENSRIELNAGFYFEDFPFYFDREVNLRYAAVFNPANSLYTIYVGHANERIAKLNHSYVPYDKVLDVIKYGRETGVKVITSFNLGMPGDDFQTTLEQAIYIRNLKKINAKVEYYKAEMHPASNIFCNSEELTVSRRIQNFVDYYTHLKEKKEKTMLHGYDLQSKLTPEEQIEIIQDIISH